MNSLGVQFVFSFFFFICQFVCHGILLDMWCPILQQGLLNWDCLLLLDKRTLYISCSGYVVMLSSSQFRLCPQCALQAKFAGTIFWVLGKMWVTPCLSHSSGVRLSLSALISLSRSTKKCHSWSSSFCSSFQILIGPLQHWWYQWSIRCNAYVLFSVNQFSQYFVKT